jgi:hypothetical protein
VKEPVILWVWFFFTFSFLRTVVNLLEPIPRTAQRVNIFVQAFSYTILFFPGSSSVQPTINSLKIQPNNLTKTKDTFLVAMGLDHSIVHRDAAA